jgi:catechol 2,3-dioxygenase-like lactoylglutathione lyase family enzyme
VPRPVGINHVAVEVGSIDEALEFFERIFGELRLRGRGRHMAFIDLGDQFIALEVPQTATSEGQSLGRVRNGHIGLVVDDQEATVERAREAGAQMIGGHDFLDPWGNHWQVVDYRDIQFTKTPRVLEGMGLGDLEKSNDALAELREKGLAD